MILGFYLGRLGLRNPSELSIVIFEQAAGPKEFDHFTGNSRHLPHRREHPVDHYPGRWRGRMMKSRPRPHR